MGPRLSGVLQPGGANFGCGKPHREDQCYMLHPKLAPPGWRTPDRRGGRRDRERNDRGRRNQRSQTRSTERRGDKDRRSDAREKSPRSSRDRIQKVDKKDRKTDTEDDSDQERRDLERRLKKLEDKKRSKTNRIRRNVFENEDDYINLEREFNNTRSSRDRNVRVVKRSDPRETSEPPCSPLTQRAAGISSWQSSESEGHPC